VQYARAQGTHLRAGLQPVIVQYIEEVGEDQVQQALDVAVNAQMATP
jgi:hypothetical protein